MRLHLSLGFQGWPVSYVTSFSSRVGYLGRSMFINLVLIRMIMHLAWKVVGENWGSRPAL